MKKRLLITGIIFFLIFKAQAQAQAQAQEENNFRKNKVAFGVKGGIIRGYIDRVDKNNLFRLEGIYGGLFLESQFHKKWSFQNEAVFTITNGYLFIETPVALKYHINNRWSIFAGPKLDILLNDNTTSFSDVQLKTFGISADIGVQYNISKKFIIEAKYSHSFTNQIEFSGLDSEKRKTLRIGIGYKF